MLNKEDCLLNEVEDLFQREDNPAHFAKNHLDNKVIFAHGLMVIKDKFNG